MRDEIIPAFRRTPLFARAQIAEAVEAFETRFPAVAA
jgi:hypothetical protein